ncbi:MAG: hypothetical protein ACYDCI_05505 [Candidatus Limnocylindrales bacterium]
MSDRRSSRPSQVRPRAPSTGRPAPQRHIPRGGSPYRVSPHKPIDRGPGLPIVARALLVLAVVGLGGVILYGATGQIGRIVGGLGSAMSNILASGGPSAAPIPSVGPIAGAPTLTAPANSYTNTPTVDIGGTVPLSLLGSSGYTITLYDTLQGKAPTVVRDQIAIPATATFTIQGVTLAKGTNVFTATIVGSGGESAASSPVTYILDTAKPKVTIVSPKDGTTVNGTTVPINGKTQAGSTVLAQNANNHTSVTTTADGTGNFTVTVTITPGSNLITLTVTDPATNVTTASLTLVRGSGKLAVALTSTAYTFSSANGANLTFAAVLTDPNGAPIASQDVTFTITLAGVPPDIQIRTTNAKGSANVVVAVAPHAADLGVGKQGSVTVAADTTFGHVQKTIVVNTAQ